jgi:hypothetical protein
MAEVDNPAPPCRRAKRWSDRSATARDAGFDAIELNLEPNWLYSLERRGDRRAADPDRRA